MTTRLYTDAANGLWDPNANTWGNVDVTTSPIRLLAVDTALYVVDFDADQVLDDIPTGAIIADEAITGAAVTARGFTFDPVTWPAVPAGQDIGAVVVYLEGTGPTDAPLFLYSDDSDDLPATPDGTDITYTPGAGGIAIL